MDHTYTLERAKAALDDTDYNSLLERKFSISMQESWQAAIICGLNSIK